MMVIETPQPDTAPMKPAKTKTIIIWGHEDLMAVAVERLLVARNDWQVFRISDERGDESLSHELKRIKPDVLVVSESIIANMGQQLIKAVQDYSELKIITIGLNDNRMKIYNKHTIFIEKASDLLTAIENSAGAGA